MGGQKVKHDKIVEKIMKGEIMLGNGFSPLFSNYPIGCGVIDIIGYDDCKRVCLVEVKETQVKNGLFYDSLIKESMMQLKKYANEINNFLSFLKMPRIDLNFIIIVGNEKIKVQCFFYGEKELDKDIFTSK